MSAFDIELSGPIASGFTGGLGGPGQGGHQPPEWYIQYGMDLGATEGSEIRAAFDGRITKYSPHDPAADNGKVYGAQFFVRSRNDMMGAFYTHMQDVPPELGAQADISRGDRLGSVLSFGGIPPHLHMALVEIIGGAPDGRYQGVDLYQLFLRCPTPESVTTVTFTQDGSPPAQGAEAGPKVYHLASLGGVQEALTVLGFDPGPADGLDGPRTRAAVTAFQQAHALPADGVAGPDTLSALAEALGAQGLTADGAP
ncbi:peptidoglycan-binding protein [Streptomyces sp. NPDC004980]